MITCDVERSGCCGRCPINSICLFLEFIIRILLFDCVLCVPVFLPGHHATETQRVIFCIPVIVGAGESVILPLVGFSVF